jgi:DNA-binding transcriptional LysR family regulator
MNRAVDIRQLRYFVAVAEERNFRRAAERLHITQPPLSRQIAELEAALGVRLLKRTTRAVELTPLGRQALDAFSLVLRQFDDALDSVAGSAAVLPRLRLALLYWFDMKGLPDFERALQSAEVASGVEVTTLASHEAVARLRRGQIDVAVVAAPIDARGLHAAVIARLRHAAFVPQASPLARKRELSLRDLESLPPFHRFRRGANPALYDHFEQQYRKLGFRPSQTLEAQDALGVFAQIGAGRGCTLMPEPLLKQRRPGMVGRRLRESITIDVAVVTTPSLPQTLRTAVERAATQLIAGVKGSVALDQASPPISSDGSVDGKRTR